MLYEGELQKSLDIGQRHIGDQYLTQNDTARRSTDILWFKFVFTAMWKGFTHAPKPTVCSSLMPLSRETLNAPRDTQSSSLRHRIL
jgi:hypothetical protein